MSMQATQWSVVGHDPDEWGVVSHEPERDHKKELAEATDRALTAVGNVSELARSHAENAAQHAGYAQAQAGSVAQVAGTLDQRVAYAMEEVRQISEALNDERRAVYGALNAITSLAHDLNAQHEESTKVIGEALGGIAESQKALADAMNRKRRVVRGADGRVQGMESV